MNLREFCCIPGYSTALFLTYDFDPVFFERIVLRELWGGGTGDIVVVADPSRIDASKPRWSHRLVHLGRRYQLVSAAVSGAFHPKIIVRAGPRGIITWVGSGNLTFGGWGGNSEMGAAWAQDGGDAVWVRTLFEQLYLWCPGGATHDVFRRIRDLPVVAPLITSAGAGPASVLFATAGKPLSSQLIRRWGSRRFKEARVLTGSTDRDGAFLRWLHDAFGVERAVVAVEPGRASFDPVLLGKLPLDAQIRKAAFDRPLHAKLYCLYGPDGNAALMGSPNCSRSAWLRDPVNGGNVEAVVVYDHLPPDLDHEVSGMFEDAQVYVPSPAREQQAIEPLAGGLRFRLAEINWEPRASELAVRFVDELPADTLVTVDVDGRAAACRPVLNDPSIWVTVASFEETARTRFVVVTVAPAGTSEKETQRHWINNHDELIHAAHGRQIENVFDRMRRRSSPHEQQQILRELHRIGAVLLNEPRAFPDSRGALLGRCEKDPGEVAPPILAVDPKKLFLSIAEVQVTRSSDHGDRRLGFSLFGVIRALFPEKPQAVHDEAIVDHEPTPDPTPDPRPLRKEPISEPIQRRLRQQMARYIEDVGQPTFSEHCSARQLVQAAAYPLVVGIRGTQDGWVSEEDAVSWARSVFDALFQMALPGANIPGGMLDRVQKRFRDEEKEQIFEDIVGDGTLWLALLGNLSIRAWSGEGGAFDRAFALRDVLTHRALLSSTDNDRIRQLIARAGWDSEATVADAVRVTEVLDRLEEDLESQWKELSCRQEKAELVHKPGDLLWNPVVGWAVAQEQAAIRRGVKIKVYLRRRATIVMVMAAGYYVNVSMEETFRCHSNALVADGDGVESGN